MFDIKAGGSGQGLCPLRAPDAVEDDEDLYSIFDAAEVEETLGTGELLNVGRRSRTAAAFLVRPASTSTSDRSASAFASTAA
ncbi:hypothetical protein ACFW9O_27850 [Streptomyces sp. NPDC059499]|uniref:hypothetical protein n=1 Tax=Streptomyces sp. NPDC059499 TaxID=3346852 RepID=UPI003678439F